jgi:hypothetical protein
MARKNLWADYRPTPKPFEDGSIEFEHFEMLQSSARPFAIQECRWLHSCRACLGWGEARGSKCQACDGTGVGEIRKGWNLYCPTCSRSGRDDDPQLQIRPGELPRREPKPAAAKTSKPKLAVIAAWPEPSEPAPLYQTKRGRPKGAKDKQPRKRRSLAH